MSVSASMSVIRSSGVMGDVSQGLLTDLSFSPSSPSIRREIELKLKFWSGLSGFHAKSAGKDSNLADVMEVLDTACDDAGDSDAEANKVEGSREAADDSSSSSRRWKNLAQVNLVKP